MMTDLEKKTFDNVCEVMHRNKKIEEMAEAMCGLNTKDGCFCDGGYCNHNCLSYEKANALYNAGYRKASEIFEEIETSLSIADFKGSDVHYVIRAEDYLHYKKKYTEGEKDDG